MSARSSGAVPASRPRVSEPQTIVGDVPVEEDEGDGGESGALARDHVKKRLLAMPFVLQGTGLCEDAKKT